jgi:competence protein ComGC
MGNLAMRRGATFVEMLLVLMLLSALLALLLPAVYLARESARRVDCEARMQSVARGISAMAERANHYPGWRQNVKAADGNTDPASWMLISMPYLDAKDVYDNWVREKDASVSRQDLQRPLWVCPSDLYKSQESGPVLSFVINAGRPDDDKPVPDYRANGIAMDLTTPLSKPVTPSYVRQADGMASTLLLSENLNATVWMAWDEEWKTTMLWHPTGAPEYAINSPAEKVARPSSNHRGGVNAMTAAGSSYWLSDDTDQHLFRRLLAPSNEHIEP